jgi:hypothetical protein
LLAVRPTQGFPPAVATADRCALKRHGCMR